MPNRNPDDSEEAPEDSGSEEDPQLQTPSNGVAEYERQRLSRIAENRSRMEALGLPKIASALWGSAQKVSEKMKKKKKRKGKEKVDDEDDDEDYRLDMVEEGLSSSSGEEENDDDDDEGYLGEKSSGSRRKKVCSLISVRCLCVIYFEISSFFGFNLLPYLFPNLFVLYFYENQSQGALAVTKRELWILPIKALTTNAL